MNNIFYDPPGRPKKTATQKMQEYFESQMLPMRLLQEHLNFEKRFSLVSQFEKYSQQLEGNRAMNEFLGNSVVSKNVQNFMDGSYVAATAQRIFEDFLPNPAPNSLEVYADSVRRAADNFINDDALFRATSLSQLVDSKKYENYLSPISQYQDAVAELGTQAYGGFLGAAFASRFDDMSPTVLALEQAKKSLNSMWPVFRHMDFSQLEADEGDVEEARQIARSAIQESTTEESLKKNVERWLFAIHQATPKPEVKLILWLYFSWFVKVLIEQSIALAMAHYAPAVLGESPQAAKKAVQENARFAVGSLELLDEYRFVSTTVLIVRQNPGALSPEIGRLSFSKPVRLLKRDKAFALVLWSDKESGAEIQGWVFARYLEKFN